MRRARNSSLAYSASGHGETVGIQSIFFHFLQCIAHADLIVVTGFTDSLDRAPQDTLAAAALGIEKAIGVTISVAI